MKERIAIFIDEANIRDCQKELNIQIDYEALTKYLIKDNEMYNCFFYGQGEYSDYHDNERSKAKFYKKLTFIGFTVKMKPIKKIPKRDNPEETEEKCNIDVELTLDAITTANNYDIAFFLTGDGDFSKLVEYLRSLGKKVYCVSTIRVSAIDFRNIVDKFINLENIKDKIKLEPKT